MTNKEKFRDQIEDFAFVGEEWAFADGEIQACNVTDCEECAFKDFVCSLKKIIWLRKEYKESKIDWANVPADTPVLVRKCRIESWHRRYFAKCENEKIYTFIEGRTSWTGHADCLEEWNYAKLAE